MTLIAALYLYDVPVLIGDVIVSRTGGTGEHRHVPTRTDVPELLPPEWQRHISGMTRKVAKLHDRLVVAWTGHCIAARAVVADLRARYRGREPDRADLAAFLQAYPELGRGVRCTLIGWLVDGRGVTSFVWHSDSRSFAAKGTERNMAYGSGAQDLYELMQERQAFHSDDQTPEDKAVGAALGLAAQVIGDELLTGRTLQTLYGGAIEALYLSEGKFVAVENVTFLFWDAEIDNTAADTTRFNLAPILMKYEYVGESLCIYRMDTKFDGSSYPTRRDIHLVSAVDLPASRFTPPDAFPMDSRWYCSFVNARAAGVCRLRTVLVLPHEDGRIGFAREPSASGVGQQLSFTVREEFVRLLHRSMMPFVEAAKQELERRRGNS